jgi:5-formyltetrahydrofolate cyclo-ligase
LGRGKGFYDRLLANVTSVKCGVAQDEQTVPILPAEPHDIAMDFILTPTRWLKTQSDGNK